MSGEPEWKWLESTRKIQEASFGVNYTELTGEKLADYLLMNAFALSDELHEAMAECHWKNWAKNRGDINNEAFGDEMADLVIFAGNMAVANGETDDSFWARVRAKQGRNAARQEHGYDAKASKCPNCRRELDKPKALVRMKVLVSPNTGDAMSVVRCAGCSSRLGVQLPGDEDITWDEGVSIPGLSAVSFTDD
jgi:hypothetical protein